MKKIFYIAVIVILVALFGSLPLTLLSKLLNKLSTLFDWIAKAINIFGWNGLISK